MSDVVLELRNVRRTFAQARQPLHVLKGVDLVVREGETVALVGPSGAGKSTLLHIAGLLEKPDSGDVVIAGQNAGRLGDDGRTLLDQLGDQLGEDCARPRPLAELSQRLLIDIDDAYRQIGGVVARFDALVAVEGKVAQAHQFAGIDEADHDGHNQYQKRHQHRRTRTAAPPEQPTHAHLPAVPPPNVTLRKDLR